MDKKGDEFLGFCLLFTQTEKVLKQLMHKFVWLNNFSFGFYHFSNKFSSNRDFF